MAIVVTPPEKVGFSKDVILWRFEDDRAGITPGINAQAYLSVGDKVFDGTQIIFRWGNNDLRFTARDTVGEYGNEIPTFPVYSVEGHNEYIQNLVPYLQNNFFLGRDFDIEAIGVPIFGIEIWVVQLTAKQRGSAYNFADTSFAGGGISMVVEGKDDSVVGNNSVYVEAWVENPDAGIFELKYGAPQLFDSNSVAEFDVASVLHASLASEVPDMLLPVAERCRQSRRRYYLRYALFGGTPPSIGQIQSTEEFVVLLGGFAQWEEGPRSVINSFKISVRESRIMKIRPALRVVRTDEPVFVSWLNTGDAGRNIVAIASVTFADGSKTITNTNLVNNIDSYDKLIFGVGFSQLSLGIYNGQGRFVTEYTVQLRDDLGPVSDEYRLVVDYGHKEYVRYFAHVSSYGCIETLMSCGKGSSYWKVFKEQAQKVLPYNFKSSEAQFVEWNATYQDNQQVATGWMRRKDLLLWLDLFIAALKYRVINGKPYAIQINSDTIQKGADGDNQHALTFEYQFARIFDSVNEELLEGEDQADIIPPNTVLAGSQNTGSAGPTAPSNFYVDPYPISGSKNPISSDGVFRLLEQFQKRLPTGDADQYLNGLHQMRSMRQAVNSNEVDPTVPTYAKTLNSVMKIVNDLQALPPETGLNVPKLGGQLASWYIQRMTHPAFDLVPPIVVERGVLFEKYLDLSLYKTSFHPDDQLDVEIVFKSDKLSGIQITADGLLVSVKGTLTELLKQTDNVLLIIRDPDRNQGSVALRIEAIDEPEVPDNRPTCPKGPFHYPQLPIEIFDNGHFKAPFDAEGVDPVDWVISATKDAAAFIRKGQEPAFNQTPFIDVTTDPVPAGSYWLGIRGVLCKSNWEWRQIVFPENSQVNFSEGYPKFNNNGTFSEFLMMVEPSGRFLTEIIKLPENTKIYSEEVDYVANTTEHQVWKAGTYADSKYRINVGTATAELTVGTPPAGPDETFKLVSGWNGAQIADLLGGDYEGPVPVSGFNASFQAANTGVAGRSYRLMLMYKVSGTWNTVPNAQSFGVSQADTTVIPLTRLFSSPGVDSRVISFQGKSLNRYGEFRVDFTLFSGVTEFTPAVKTIQKTFKLHAFEILGTVSNLGGQPNRYCPLIRKVLYDGKGVVDDNSWVEPFGGGQGQKLEYSVDGGNTWYNDVSPTPDSWGGEGAYSNVWILNNNPIDNFPKGSTKQVIFRNPSLPSVRSSPYSVANSPDTSDPDPTPLGTYLTADAGGRRFTYTKSPEVRLAFNADGTISDVTPGLQPGTPNKLDGRNIFYGVNYSTLVSNGDGVPIYSELKNLRLRDGVHTLRVFNCDASKFPTLETFMAESHGYGSNGLNKYNARLSEITIAIRTESNPGIPKWLIASRKMNFGAGAKNKSFRNDKIFAMEAHNVGDAHSVYHAKAAHTRMLTSEDTIDQPYSFHTFKWPWDGLPIFTNEQLYNSFRGFIDSLGLTKDTVITDEFPENAQGQDPTIYDRMYHAYKGALDKFRETEPGLDKSETNLYGSYGADTFPQHHINGSKALVAESLDSKVWHNWDATNQTWAGVQAYFSSGQIDVRNINASYYMYNGFQFMNGIQRNLPYELVYINERVKIGTKTYNGQDRESKWMVFTTTLVQTLVRDGNGAQIGIEEVRTGDVIPFPNGEVLSVYNTPSAAVAGEYFDLAFWSTFVGNGIAIWASNNFGTDATKISTYEPLDQPIFWTKNGGSREDWVSGQNGAPVNDGNGVADLLYATVVDYAHYGYEEARGILDCADTLYFASYTSSRKSFTPAPGNAGLHLNGFGPLNMNSLSFVDGRDQKAGLAIVGVGGAGKVAVYYNGYLSAQEYEDNVTVTHAGSSVNLGRVYGRQTKFIKF
ncbi:hypothetical protein SAMN04487996_10432 [Dyadobacter soli]|uniref:Uncharacterized protein n=1 Tax=Dyadobacter soli TaxID=659014 RepID=A0A1G7B073_9BACT|nr:hypothetical protein [Dyadobacter soli]SDE20443.1 hypothetical protein SAMN04487996_10432 [Dyadobacter soli]